MSLSALLNSPRNAGKSGRWCGGQLILIIKLDFGHETSEFWHSFVEPGTSLLQTMDECARKRFYDLAERDKQRFDLEMVNHVPAEKRKRQKRDPDAPKRPLSVFFSPLTILLLIDADICAGLLREFSWFVAYFGCRSCYFWFCHEERANVKAALGNPGSIIEVGKELGRRWAVVTPQQKAGYDLLAAKDKQRYEKVRRWCVRVANSRLQAFLNKIKTQRSRNTVVWTLMVSLFLFRICKCTTRRLYLPVILLFRSRDWMLMYPRMVRKKRICSREQECRRGPTKLKTSGIEVVLSSVRSLFLQYEILHHMFFSLCEHWFSFPAIRSTVLLQCYSNICFTFSFFFRIASSLSWAL